MTQPPAHRVAIAPVRIIAALLAAAMVVTLLPPLGSLEYVRATEGEATEATASAATETEVAGLETTGPSARHWRTAAGRSTRCCAMPLRRC